MRDIKPKLIDLDKLRADIAQAERWHAGVEPKPPRPVLTILKLIEEEWNAFYWWNFIVWKTGEYLTQLYSLRAHHRARQHLKQRWIVNPSLEERLKGISVIKVDLTMDDQAKLVANLWEKYKLPVPVAPAASESI